MATKKTSTRKIAPKKSPAAAPKKKAAKRTVKQAAKNVQSSAERARELGAAIVRAGEMLEQGAAVLDSMADRSTHKRTRKKP